MAKRKNREPREGIQLPPRVAAAIFAVFALLAVFAAVVVFWQAWNASNLESLRPRLETYRTTVAKEINDHVSAARERFDQIVTEPKFRADVEAGALEDAGARIGASWPGLVKPGVFPAELEQLLEAEPDAGGFGRLALLASVISEGEPSFRIVDRGDNMALGLGMPLRTDDGRLLAVAYGQLPMAELTAPLRSRSLPGGYLQFRSGQTLLMEAGDDSLRYELEWTPVPDLPMRVGTAAPEYVSTLAYAPSTQLGIGIGALFLALVMGWKTRQALRQAVGVVKAGPEPTFAEALEGLRDQEPDAVTPRAVAGDGKKKKAAAAGVQLDRSIFRAYDIRGVLDKTLDAGIARKIGQAIGTVMAEQGLQEIVVGRDGRLSGPDLSAALIEGLREAGRDVIDIGQAPTPVVYFASYHLEAGSCVAVTGSHNPPDYNGFKIVIGNETLAGEAIEDLYLRIIDGLLEQGGNGGLQSMDIAGDYISRIADDVQLERRIRVVVDAGNGVAGAIAPQVLEAIGAEVETLYCEVDGEFPNHHPDPSDPTNLADLQHVVARVDADLGLAFDGDGDRLGVITRSGEIIYPDRVLMLFARDVLSRNPGGTVIYDVKCTGHLAGQILRHGGSPLMWKTGHSLIKAKMRETHADLAGEMSGHFFFQERWYGFDDGIYAAARLLEIIAADDRDPQEIFDELPKGASTPELKVEMREGEHYAYIERFVQGANFEDAKISTIDGLRADWSDGWGLVRCSNTTPSLVLRFDADDEEALSRIQEAFRAQLLAVDPDLELPF